MPAETRLSPRARRVVLEQLTRQRLSELTEKFELEVADRRSTEAHIDAIVRKRSLDFAQLLDLLRAEELRSACTALGLEARGREKAKLIARILGQDVAGKEGSDQQQGATQPSEEVAKPEEGATSPSSPPGQPSPQSVRAGGALKSALRRFVLDIAGGLRGRDASVQFTTQLLRCFGWTEEHSPDAVAPANVAVVANGKRSTREVALLWQSRRVLLDVVKHDVMLDFAWKELLGVCLQVTPQPQYVVLTNQRDLHLYDLARDRDAPRLSIALDDLPKYSEAFPFLSPDWVPGTTPKITDVTKVSREVAELVARLYRSLKEQHPERERDVVQFTLQCILTMFAEDIGLLPREYFTSLLYEGARNRDAEQRLAELFRQMSTRELPTPRVVPFFNGGLFTNAVTLPLGDAQLGALTKASDTDGVTGANIMQLDELIANGYNGNNGAATDIHAAMFEWSEIQSAHNGYKDGSAASTRFAGMFLCNENNINCTAKPSMSVASTHYIMTSGIFMGDLEDGQDAAVTNQTERRRRSGYATEVNTYLYAVTNDAYADVAWNHMANRSPLPRVLSMSAGWADMYESTLVTVGCNGDGIRERQYDENLYENGILPVISAGNAGGEDVDGNGVCRLVSPASALGAFVVGGYGIPNDYSVCNQRQHPLEPASSRGKGSIYDQGRYRTMIDGAAPYYQNWRFGPNSNYAAFAGGTSLSAPAAAAMAVDLIDHSRNNSSNPGIYDDPGIVNTLMLLMGDRTDYNGNQRSSGFDMRLGSGRLKARGRTTDMLDAPYYIGVGSTCVDDGETVTIKVNYNSGTGVHSPIPADSNAGKAVIWWYDRRFDDTGDLDDIDLKMLKDGSLLAQSTSNYDEKEMVYRTDASNGKISIQIIGDDVTADNEGCGTNSMKVYYAYRFEDSDRDDADGPSYDTSTCIGVEPE